LTNEFSCSSRCTFIQIYCLQLNCLQFNHHQVTSNFDQSWPPIASANGLPLAIVVHL
jgi:hypothetical protein